MPTIAVTPILGFSPTTAATPNYPYGLTGPTPQDGVVIQVVHTDTTADTNVEGLAGVAEFQHVAAGVAGTADDSGAWVFAPAIPAAGQV